MVLPDGTLTNGFNWIQAVSNRDKQRGYNVEVIRSTDKGQTWSAPVRACRPAVGRRRQGSRSDSAVPGPWAGWWLSGTDR
jgi:hypothetical protein